MHKYTLNGPRLQRIFKRGMLTAVSVACLALPAMAQEVPNDAIPNKAPRYFPPAYRSAMSAPLPFSIGNETLPASIPASGTERNSAGSVGFVTSGRVLTIGKNEHPFFQSLGSNGRSCGTCHQPSMGMGLSVDNIKERFKKFGVRDPLFAPVDGANCPDLVPASETKPSKYYGGRRGRGKNSDSAKARSLLLNFGLIRVFMPLTKPNPPQNPITKIVVKSDPYGCNKGEYNEDPDPDKNSTDALFSMYRRPLISANLAFKEQFDFFGPPSGPNSGNIMWDGREPTLKSQALDATLGHAQRDNVASNPLGGELTQESEVITKIVDYERAFFTAQQTLKKAGALDAGGATGGAEQMRNNVAGKDITQPDFPAAAIPPFNEFDAWATSSPAIRQSIQRGQALFNGQGPLDTDGVTRRGTFVLDQVAGINDLIGFPLPGFSCAACHSGLHGGGDMLQKNQRNIGLTGDFAGRGGHPLRTDLPIFEVTCKEKPAFEPSNVFQTNDPGLALHTGECADVGKTTVPSIRALAPRAPYFHDGSAKTLGDVVNFYNTRFSINLTYQEKTDLVNFLAAL